MRMVLGCAIILGLAVVAPATAQKSGQKKGDKDKAAEIDPDKLIGKWSPPPIKGIKGAKLPVREFTKEGKSYILGPDAKGPGLGGPYKLDGNKLTITYTDAEGKVVDKQEWTIKKLTDTDLVLVAGKLMESHKRVKK